MFTHEIKVQRSKVPYIIGGVLVVLLLALALVPFPHQIKGGYALQPASFTEITAPRGGTIVQVVATENSIIEQGGLLAKFDPAESDKKLKDLQDNLAAAEKKQKAGSTPSKAAVAAKAALTKAEAAAKSAQADLDKANAKAKGPAVDAAKKKQEAAQAALEKAQKAYDDAAPSPEALADQIKKLQADIATTQAEIASPTLTAPRAGLVTSLQLKQGQAIKAGDVVAKLGDISKLRVMLSVPKAETLKPGEEVELKVGNDKLATKVDTGGEGSGEAALDNSKGTVNPPMEGEATIKGSPRPMLRLGK